MTVRKGEHVIITSCPNNDPRHIGKRARILEVVEWETGTFYHVARKVGRGYTQAGCFASEVKPVKTVRATYDKRAPRTAR